MRFWIPMLSWLFQIQQAALALALSPPGEAAGFLRGGCLEGAALEEVGLPISGRPLRLSAQPPPKLQTVFVAEFARRLT
jgi:hypothetical protein